MKKSYYQLIILFLPFLNISAQAQMASASIFSEMKSINPAVINGRAQGQYTLSSSMDSIEKYQLVQETDDGFGGIAREETDTVIDVDSYSFFRGGKGNGLFTTELQFLKSSGVKKITHKATGLDDVIISNDVTFQNIDFSVGIGKYIGLGVARQTYNYQSKFSFTFDGNTFSEDIKEDITGNILKAGLVLPFKVLKLAANLEYAKLTTESEKFLVMTGYETSETSTSTQTLGVAAGFTTKKSHFEVGYEKILSSDKTNLSPTRISATAEIKIWKLALGYTGRMYNDGFQDNDKVVYNELVYSDEVTQSRVEHIVNFAFGSDKGFTIGGSGSISKATVKEENPYYKDQFGKLDTEVEQLALAVKLGYVW